MSIEEKAKAYDEALERARKLAYHYDSNGVKCTNTDIESIFPELVESEDEKIRKSIINLVIKSAQNGGMALHKWESQQMLAWLEKQGEQKPADKVEPKFKVGDYIVYRDYVWKVFNISLEKYYELLKINNEVSTRSIEDVDNNAHLWTIQDAKDGDVLAVDTRPFIYNGKVNPLSVGGYCGIACDGSFKKYKESKGYSPNGWTFYDCDIYPATKEQRNLLFSKMKEAGYEWDAEKKKLRKIEQKPVEWSEEDKNMLNQIINSGENHCYLNLKEINWLKSLHPQKWQ